MNKENGLVLFKTDDVKLVLEEASLEAMSVGVMYFISIYDSDNRYVNNYNVDTDDFMTSFLCALNAYVSDPKYGGTTMGVVNMINDSFGDDMRIFKNPTLRESIEIAEEYGAKNINRIGDILIVWY